MYACRKYKNKHLLGCLPFSGGREILLLRNLLAVFAPQQARGVEPTVPLHLLPSCLLLSDLDGLTTAERHRETFLSRILY